MRRPLLLARFASRAHREDRTGASKGPIVRFDPSKGALDAFLREHRPAVPLASDTVSWIEILAPDTVLPEVSEIELKADWDRLVQTGRVTIESVAALAKKHLCMAGKWLFFCHAGNVDARWHSIAKAVAEGSLGPKARVSPVRPNSPSAVIEVYTKDCGDQADALRVRRGLRELGEAESITYKPEVFSLLGIYRGNPYGLRPSILAA